MKAAGKNWPGGGISAHSILTSGISRTAGRSSRTQACASGRRAPFLFGKTRRGFTLVEVIVVLVILAILAAIAIPALTGYIDKAEDKKYIADARNEMIAYRTLLIEDYNEGMFEKNATVKGYFLNGTGDTGLAGWTSAGKKKAFSIANPLAYQTHGSDVYYIKKATALTGKTDFLDSTGNNKWTVPYASSIIFGPDNAETTLINADGFVYLWMPEGQTEDKPLVVVTYKLAHIEGINENDQLHTNAVYTKFKNAAYNANEGYYVYHLRW
jgi:prepilin-type N-terminal cleavage/methylation domain-containing protein